MPYVFKDDGYPEAREFEDNYVPMRSSGSRVELRPARRGCESLFSLLARLKGKPARIAARAEPGTERLAGRR